MFFPAIVRTSCHNVHFSVQHNVVLHWFKVNSFQVSSESPWLQTKSHVYIHPRAVFMNFNNFHQPQSAFTVVPHKFGNYKQVCQRKWEFSFGKKYILFMKFRKNNCKIRKSIFRKCALVFKIQKIKKTRLHRNILPFALDKTYFTKKRKHPIIYIFQLSYTDSFSENNLLIHCDS